MRPPIRFVFPAFLIAGPLWMISSFGATAPVFPTDVAPVVDGEIDVVWPEAAQHPIESDDPESLSAYWSALFDATHFYVLVDVADDVLVAGADHNVDRIEVYFVMDNVRDGSGASAGPSSNRFQYAFNYDRPAQTFGNGNWSGVDWTIVETDGGAGYRIEAAFPWSGLGVDPPAPGFVFGFDVAINDRDNGPATTATYFWNNTGTHLWSNLDGAGNIMLTVPGYPVITSHPRSQVAEPGDTVVFSVEADGEAPLSYLWLKDNEPVSSEGGPTLTLGDVSVSDAGVYSVRVSNEVGQTQSAEAALTVEVVAPELPSALADAEPMGNGVFHSDWFGDFSAGLEFGNWIYSFNYGWLYVYPGQPIGSMWFWDPVLQDFLYASAGFYAADSDYSYLYSNLRQWMIIARDPSNAFYRMVYVLNDEAWLEFGEADTEPPSAAANVTVVSLSHNQVTLHWDASVDNVGVAGYDVFRDGELLDTTKQTGYTDSALDPETTYEYLVYAFDAAGNRSAPSSAVQATTLALEFANIDAAWDFMMAVGTRTVGSITEWYERYTGFDGDAYALGGYADDLGGRNLTVDDLTPSGPVTTTHDGQVIERMHVTGRVRIIHENVVVRGCRIVSISSGQNGMDIAAANATVEYNTFIGPGSGTGSDRAIWVTGSGATVRFSKLDGAHSSAFQNQSGSGGSFWEYNYVPGIRRFPGSHNTSTTFCATRGDQSVYMRNFIRDGTSAILSLYPQDWCGGAIDNLFIAENILESCCANLWYYINSGGRSRDDWSPITNTEFRDNVFIPGNNPQGVQRRPLGDEAGPFTQFTTYEGNVWSGNQLLNGSPLDL